MVPVWLLGLCLAGLFLPQTYGVPYADSAAALADIVVQDPIGLVERDYLFGDNSEIQLSEDLDDNVDSLQKRKFHNCGSVPLVANASSKVLQRITIYTCKEGYEILGGSVIFCDVHGHWSRTPLCLPRPKFYVGPKGETGDVGPMGPKGETGDAGAMGQMGLAGRPGRRGSPGAQGHSGSMGARGQQGLSGAQGTAGANGRNGLNGTKGADGDTGSPGAPGFRGRRGEQGFRGEPGDPGPQGGPGNFMMWRRSAFCVKLGSGSVTCGQPVGFQEILYNEDGDFNTITGMFVCRIAGVYSFHAYFEVNTRSALMAIIVNGQTVYRNYQSYSSYPELSTVGTILRLNVGDKVWVQAEDSKNGICHNSYFMGYLIYERK